MGAQKDGRDLERAVWFIERLILEDFGLASARTTIEPRKRLTDASGVPDEIDLYVRIESAPGYESVFVFECKDRAKASDKTDVETLRGKMDRTSATAGYLIARRFTKAARALAEQYPKMKLRLAADVPVEPFLERYEAGYFFLRDYRTETFTDGVLPDDMRGASVSFMGVTMPFPRLVQQLATVAATERVGSELWPMEPYFGQTFLFKPGEVFLAGLPLGMLTIEATIESFEHPPERVVGFEVEGRGRVVQFFYRLPDGSEHMVALTALTADRAPEAPDREPSGRPRAPR